jgi:retinoblastoma-like protein 1
VQVLKGNVSDLSGILEQGRFDHNYKTVNRIYEEYVLSEGDFDERIFLGKILGNLIMFIFAIKCNLLTHSVSDNVLIK